jgi:8-oxo-dGTP pyrophosphatase MutT (NUDIX family)
MNITLDTIQAFLREFQPHKVESENFVHAGVLIALFFKNDDLHVILTQRTDEVQHHKGQVSFPGGVKDAADTTIIETALREAYEEIGLSQKAIDVLGVLSDFTTPSGFRITPIVAFLSSLPVFHWNKAEVLEVFDVPISFFLDSQNERIERHERNGVLVNLYFYKYGKHEIWGATAAILRSFLRSVSDWEKVKKAL